MEQALLNASKNNQLSVIKLLTQKKINLNYRDNFGKTALIYCALKGNLDAVKHLISCGADPNIADDFSNTVLHHAVASKNREAAKFLLTVPDTDVNAKNRDGSTALLMAVDAFDRDMVELLLKAGAEDLPDNKNLTALDLASKNGASSIVELLLTVGTEAADVQAEPQKAEAQERVPQAQADEKPVTPEPISFARTVGEKPAPQEGQSKGAPVLHRISCEQCGNHDMDLSMLDKGIIICPACHNHYIKDARLATAADVEAAVKRAMGGATEKKKGWFSKRK